MKLLRKIHVMINYNKEFKVDNKARINQLISDRSKTSSQYKLELIQWKKAFMNRKEQNKKAEKAHSLAVKDQAKKAKKAAKKSLELQKNRDSALVELAKKRANK